MARTPTINNQGNIEWTEKVSSPDGDNLVIGLELDAIDSGSGFVQQDAASSNLSWLSFSTSSNIKSNGNRSIISTIEVDPSQLSVRNSYRFEISAEDGLATSSRKVVLDVKQSKLDGTKMYLIANDSGDINEYNLSTAWDTSTASKLHSKTNQENILGLFFRKNGKSLFAPGGGQIYEYDLSGAWNITTASVKNSINAQDDSPRDVFIRGDGKKMYELANTAETIYEYDLSTGWDLSTATVNQSVSVQDSWPEGLFFSPDGKKMYETGNSEDNIYESDLSTAWDLSTATFKQSINAQASNTEELFFRSDGKKMYEVAQSTGKVYESNLSSAWDISTSTLVRSASVAGSTFIGIFFGQT